MIFGKTGLLWASDLGPRVRGVEGLGLLGSRSYGLQASNASDPCSVYRVSGLEYLTLVDGSLTFGHPERACERQARVQEWICSSSARQKMLLHIRDLSDKDVDTLMRSSRTI